MTDDKPQRTYYWMCHTDGEGRWRAEQGAPPGEELAALRRGLGREAGAVPAMWRFYSTLREDGYVTHELIAEHIALSLFGLHQQSQPQPMHRRGIGLGKAVLALRKSEKFSSQAVDRRFAAAATATSPAELAMHLRGLVSQLRTIRQGLDYTRLFYDLWDWHRPERVAAVRRRWGAQYFVWTADAADVDKATAEASESA